MSSVCTGVLHVFGRKGGYEAQRGLLFLEERGNLCAESLPASLGVKKERLKTVLASLGEEED